MLFQPSTFLAFPWYSVGDRQRFFPATSAAVPHATCDGSSSPECTSGGGCSIHHKFAVAVAFSGAATESDEGSGNSVLEWTPFFA